MFQVNMKIVLTFITVCVTIASAKQCYSCSSIATGVSAFPAFHRQCGDTFDKESNTVPLVECSTICMKLKAEGNGQQFVVRSCGVFGSSICREGSYSQQGVSGSMKCCSGDKCNSATSLMATFTATLAVIIAIFLFA